MLAGVGDDCALHISPASRSPGAHPIPSIITHTTSARVSTSSIGTGILPQVADQQIALVQQEPQQRTRRLLAVNATSSDTCYDVQPPGGRSCPLLKSWGW